MSTKLLILCVLTLCIRITNSAVTPSSTDEVAYYICWSFPTGDGYDYSCAIQSQDPISGASGIYIGDAAHPVWSPDGSKIAYRGPDYGSNAVNGTFVMTLSDSTVVTLPDAAWLTAPAWSPDSSRIAIQASADGQLYVLSADGAITNRLTSGLQIDSGLILWSPDGQRIVFNCELESGNKDICAINADGTRLVRLTSDLGSDSNASFSPDGGSIAFVTTRFGADSEIAVMNGDGTAIRRLGAGVLGSWPAWSPDGSQIAFTRPSGGVSVVSPDGGSLHAVGPGERPVWSPNGLWIASSAGGGGACQADGTLCWTDSVAIMSADGTGIIRSIAGTDPDWTGSRPPVASFTVACSGTLCDFDASGSTDVSGSITGVAWDFGDGTTAAGPSLTHLYAGDGSFSVKLTITDNNGATGTRIQVITTHPVASFTYSCNVLTCTFDGSSSQGSVTNYTWSFGDGSSGVGRAAVHTYAAAGRYVVTLSVGDELGSTGTTSQNIRLNSPPTASFTSTCNALACTFNASGSSDADGTIVGYAWTLGDGTTGAGATLTHVYAAAGTFTVTLLVTDNSGGVGSRTTAVTVVPPTTHIGDLDGGITNQGLTWTASVTVTVHDGAHAPLANVVVLGTRNDGSTVSCTTDATGRCSVARPGILKRIGNVGFRVTAATRAPFVYKPTDNHDPDSDSNGTAITVLR